MLILKTKTMVVSHCWLQAFRFLTCYDRVDDHENNCVHYLSGSVIPHNVLTSIVKYSFTDESLSSEFLLKKIG